MLIFVTLFMTSPEEESVIVRCLSIKFFLAVFLGHACPPYGLFYLLVSFLPCLTLNVGIIAAGLWWLRSLRGESTVGFIYNNIKIFEGIYQNSVKIIL